MYNSLLNENLWIDAHSQNVTFRRNPEFRKKLFERFDTASHYENLLNPSLILGTELPSRYITHTSGKVISQISQQKFCKNCQFFQKTSKIHKKG